MTQLTIIGPCSRGTVFVVHKAGCRDIARAHDDKFNLEAETIREVVEYIYCDHIGESDSPWTDYAGDFKFLPCCRGDLK